jgi:hypothetical protein
MSRRSSPRVTLTCPACRGLTEARQGPYEALVHRCECGYAILESEWEPYVAPCLMPAWWQAGAVLDAVQARRTWA